MWGTTQSKLPSPQERLDLLLLGLSRRESVKSLCQQAGVSREVFYRWLKRVREAALRALEAKAPGPAAPGAKAKAKKPKRRGPAKPEMLWSIPAEIEARGMVLAGRTLYVAGPPDFLGSGTSDDPYQIATTTDLGGMNHGDLEACYALAADIDLSDTTWTGVAGPLVAERVPAPDVRLRELLRESPAVDDALGVDEQSDD